jgi:hypothetical protein
MAMTAVYVFQKGMMKARSQVRSSLLLTGLFRLSPSFLNDVPHVRILF